MNPIIERKLAKKDELKRSDGLKNKILKFKQFEWGSVDCSSNDATIGKFEIFRIFSNFFEIFRFGLKFSSDKLGHAFFQLRIYETKLSGRKKGEISRFFKFSSKFDQFFTRHGEFFFEFRVKSHKKTKELAFP